MAYFFPLLFCLGLGGGVLLLSTDLIPKLRPLHKLIIAVLMTLLTLVWVAAPVVGQWALSVWSPISVVGGWWLLELTPAIWWATLMIGASVSGVLWVDLAERQPKNSAGCILLMLLFTVIWLVFGAGSILMSLALWAVFDVVWIVVRLTADPDGERVIWAAAVQGCASVLLWTISLFLLREGASGIWRLMRPSEPVLILLHVAAAVRLGFYPFQIINTQALSRSHPVSLMSALNPLMGIALLYRLLLLPGGSAAPVWVLIWGVLSVLWLGIKGFGLKGRQALLVVGHGVLLAIATGAAALGRADLLLMGAGTWVACMALLIVARRGGRRGVTLSWSTAIAFYFLIGAPPSPLFSIYLGLFEMLPWGWRIVQVLGLAISIAVLLGSSRGSARGRVLPPRPYLLLCTLTGLMLMIGVLIGAAFQVSVAFESAVPLALWALAVSLSVVLLLWGDAIRRAFDDARALVDLFDLQWFFGAVWQGAENLLGVVRVAAEVVEGSGSILWSVLILLLVLMILGR